MRCPAPIREDVAQEVTIVVEAGRGDVARDHERGPGGAVAEMTLEDRRGGERRRRVAGRKRAALAGRTRALDRYFDGEREPLAQELGLEQIESHV